MKELFFVGAFIWLIASAGSIFLGSFVGIDREKHRSALQVYWNEKSASELNLLVRRTTLVFAWIGFYFPVIFPIPGFAGAMLLASLFALFR